MAVPEYARITGKTIAHVEIETERVKIGGDAQNVQELDRAVVIHCVGGSSLRIFVDGFDDRYPWLDFDFTPGRPRAAAVPKRSTAKKKR